MGPTRARDEIYAEITAVVGAASDPLLKWGIGALNKTVPNPGELLPEGTSPVRRSVTPSQIVANINSGFSRLNSALILVSTSLGFSLCIAPQRMGVLVAAIDNADGTPLPETSRKQKNEQVLIVDPNSEK